MDRVSVQLFGVIGVFYGSRRAIATMQRWGANAGISTDLPDVRRRDIFFH